MAKTTFGILLIHANSDAMRQWLWQDVVRVPQMIDSPNLIPYAILCVCGIFAVCAAIDFVLDRLIFNKINRICPDKGGYWQVNDNVDTKTENL